MLYYDIVLGLIPASLIGGTGILHALGLGFTTAVPIAAGLAAAIIIHALFFRAPTLDRANTNPQPPGLTD